MAVTAAVQSGYVDSSANAGKSDKGTKIVQNTDEMDKNAFLKILCAELANQNPENATDGTQYISQMAQFSSLEQMSNLSTNMQFSNASNLIGKIVVMNKNNQNMEPYTGVISSITKNGSNIKVVLKYGTGDDDIKQFDLSDIKEVCAG